MRFAASDDDVLFAGGRLMEWLDERLAKARHDVESYPSDDLLGAQPDALLDYFTSRHSVEDVILRDGHDDIEADEPVEVTMQVMDSGRPVRARGALVRFYPPFLGEPALFRLQGSTILSLYPRALVGDGSLVFELSEQDANPESLKAKLGQQLRLGRDWLQGVTPKMSS